jgi:hypothetical protein
MNYQELAGKLLHVAERLQKHANKLEGDVIGKSAVKLATDIERFDATLDGFLASRKSGELFLETLLRSPAAKKHLSLDLLRKALRESCSKRLKAEELVAAKKEFVETVHEQDRAEAASKFLKHAFAEAAYVAPAGKEKGQLQQEFYALGRLSEDEYATTIAKRTFGELRRLAATNGIRFTDKTTKPHLIKMIRRYARRLATNLPSVAA